MASEPSVDIFSSNHPPHGDEERCPWCDQSITHQKFQEIQTRIEAEERRRQLEIREQMKAEHQQQLTAQRTQHEDALKAATQAKDAELVAAKVAADKREAAAKVAGAKEAQTIADAKVKAAEEAKVLAEAKAKQLAETEEERFNEKLRAALSEAREAAEKVKETALQKKDSEAFKEKQRLEKTISDLQRQVARQTSDELGEAAEIDLFDELEVAFEDDVIKRVKKGEPGADIRQDIMVNGERCGRLLFESKNRKVFQARFATKLREDQLADGADHAILATRVFPPDTNQLHLHSGVILAHPARVVALATMLREQVIRIYKANLSQEQRDQKTAELYDYINSEQCHNVFEQVDAITESILELDATEQKQHQKNWNKRGDLVKTVQRLVLGQLQAQIERIVEGEGSNE